MEASKEFLEKVNYKPIPEMNVELIKYPTAEDWKWVKTCTLNTVGKKSLTDPTDDWKERLIKSEHSPIRELVFGFKMTIPYWVSVHFVRHHVGVNHYVQSQRNDRQRKYDRTEAAQGEMVSHIMSINAQSLINMAHKRLCTQASPETRRVMEMICYEVELYFPYMRDILEPQCMYRNGKCTEFNPCGLCKGE